MAVKTAPLDQEIIKINSQLKDVNIDNNYVKEDLVASDVYANAYPVERIDLHQINQNSNESLLSYVNEQNMPL